MMEQQGLFGGEEVQPTLRRKSQRFKPHEIDQIVADYQKGVSATELAKQWRSTRQSINYLLEKRGIRPDLPRGKNTSRGDQEWFVELWKCGFTAQHIATMMGTTWGRVSKAISRLGAKDKRGRGAFTLEQEQQILKEYQTGQSSCVLANRYDVFESTILDVVRRQGGKVHSSQEGVPEGMWRCAGCKEIKQQEKDFYKLRSRRRYSNYCRECWNARAKTPEAERSRRKYRAGLRREMIQAYGGKCSCCGESQPEFLTIDHVHGGGGRERKTHKLCSTRFYIRLKRHGWPKERFALLCFNCNMGKGRYSCCPHQGEQNRKPDSGLSEQGREYRKLRRELLAAYGDKCYCCGETIPEFLALDHIYGGGSREVRQMKGAKSLWRRLRKEGWPKDRYRLACHNCNCARRNGICPHQRAEKSETELTDPGLAAPVPASPPPQP